jgi:hypothetical protein
MRKEKKSETIPIVISEKENQTEGRKIQKIFSSPRQAWHGSSSPRAQL